MSCESLVLPGQAQQSLLRKSTKAGISVARSGLALWKARRNIGHPGAMRGAKRAQPSAQKLRESGTKSEEVRKKHESSA